MQITPFWDDEHTVASDEQLFCDQFDRHLGVARENLVEQGGHGPEVIHDDNSNSHISRQVAQQAGIGVEATGRTSYTNYRKISLAALFVFIGNGSLRAVYFQFQRFTPGG